MTKNRTTKITLIPLLGLASLALAAGVVANSPAPVSAYGPERTTFTNEKPASYPVFNSITNNAAVGDERDFVRIVEVHDNGDKDAYTSQLKVEAGKEYEVYIYYHNNASSTYNDKAHNYVGVAREVRLASQFSQYVKPDAEGEVNATITWKNWDLTDGNPGKIWDEAFLTSDSEVELHYKTGSATIHNGYKVNGSVLSTNLFSDSGTYIGLNELNGIILGCDEYSGHITYRLVATAVGEEVPTEDTPTETPTETTETTTPSVMPNTGPAEIALAITVIIIIAAGSYYWIRSRRGLKATTKKAKGKK